MCVRNSDLRHDYLARQPRYRAELVQRMWLWSR